MRDRTLYPFSVECVEPSVPVFRLSDGRYQLTKDGPIVPFMYGPEYFLVEQQLADFLDGFDIVGLRFEPAIIWHRRIDRQYSTHTRLIVDRLFVSDSIGAFDLAGNQVYSMNDTYLFVSPELKERLEAVPFNYLRFSKGLSGFAGRFRATSSPS